MPLLQSPVPLATAPCPSLPTVGSTGMSINCNGMTVLPDATTASRNRFVDLWRLFLGHSAVRSWLCDSTPVSPTEALSSSHRTPIVVGTDVRLSQNVSSVYTAGTTTDDVIFRTRHSLVILSEDGGFALGVLLDEPGQPTDSFAENLHTLTARHCFEDASVSVRRTALVHYPGQNVFVKADFVWLRSGVLAVHFGTIQNTQSFVTGSTTALLNPDDILCSFGAGRTYPPGAAKRISAAARNEDPALAAGIAALIAPADGFYELNAFDKREVFACSFCAMRGILNCVCSNPLRQRAASPTRMHRSEQRGEPTVLTPEHAVPEIDVALVEKKKHTASPVARWKYIEKQATSTRETVLSTFALHVAYMRKKGYDCVLQVQKALHAQGQVLAPPMPQLATQAAPPSLPPPAAVDPLKAYTPSEVVFSSICPPGVEDGSFPVVTQQQPWVTSIEGSDAAVASSTDMKIHLNPLKEQGVIPSIGVPLPVPAMVNTTAATGHIDLGLSIRPAAPTEEQTLWNVEANRERLSPGSAGSSNNSDSASRSVSGSSASSGIAEGAVNKRSPKGKGKALQCLQCGAFIRGKRGNLNRHIAAKHHRIRGFSCGMPGCGQAFQSKLNLVRHMTRVHEGRVHRCGLCPRGFRSAAALAKHAAAAHAGRTSFSCAKCGVCFGRRSVLDNHMERVHGDNASNNVTAAIGAALQVTQDAPAFECSMAGCLQRFSDWTEAKKHEQLVHGGRVHQCPSCEEIFDAEDLLSRHIRTDHGRTNASRKCEICGCMYSEKSNLLRHMRLAHKEYVKSESGDESVGIEE